MRATRPWMLMALLLALAAHAGEPARFPVYLKDGRVLQSSKRPHSLNGKVGIYDEQRRLSWLPASDVDLGRSRAEWTTAAGRADLDRDSLTGKTLFPIEFVAMDGAKGTLPTGDAAFTFVEIWHPY